MVIKDLIFLVSCQYSFIVQCKKDIYPGTGDKVIGRIIDNSNIVYKIKYGRGRDSQFPEV